MKHIVGHDTMPEPTERAIPTAALIAQVEEYMAYPTPQHFDERPAWCEIRASTLAALRELRDRVARLEAALTDYADHIAWRCEYRTRYKKCMCGLDETMLELGLSPVPVNDPEAREAHDAVARGKLGLFSTEDSLEQMA